MLSHPWRRMNRRTKVFLWLFSISLAGAVCIWTALIPRWGAWYSPDPILGMQARRLLHGKAALSENPVDLRWDLAWGNASVQQVWGLGVPIWRLPFEIIAAAFGNIPFPDRIAFAAALAGVVFLAAKFLFTFFGANRRATNVWIWLGLLPSVLFPPFLAVCSSRFMVYEEVAAYGFIAGLTLMFMTASVCKEATPFSFGALAIASGLVPFVRPTLGTYGLASLVLASIAVWIQKRSFRWIGCGVGLFLVGIGLLLCSNRSRFGSCLEFGHSLNTNSLPAMAYGLRFDHPYRSEPLPSAARELFSLLFGTRSLIVSDYYAPRLFPGQSPTWRWRELYFSTYDLSYFCIIALVWGWLSYRICFRLRKKGSRTGLQSTEVLASWSLLGTMPLIAFYLRAPFMSSRYLIDFAPALVAAWLVLFRLLQDWTGKLRSRIPWPTYVLALVLCIWWAHEVMTIQQLDGNDTRNTATTADGAVGSLETWAAPKHHGPIPPAYTNGFAFAAVGIPFNGTGWNSTQGETKACVSLFVENPECLIVDLAPLQPDQSAPAYDCIRAKIGCEQLERERASPLPGGIRIYFRGPKNSQYQTGIQLVSLGMMRREELTDGESNFLLKKVSWHRESTP